ncbi:sterol desaturase/SRPBCC family protein [Chitinimonas koreensis]|uniref:sterol desaturase/SRPBCC family protein n=1 Tax=Chitinimonas koreensis TaxID=356302 RepID=UPI0006875A7F|nr:SRPBCC family protein [Chitinimonas koreensis]QNM97675.1 SRPBCC family protein [Chitinimonas koreensis]
MVSHASAPVARHDVAGFRARYRAGVSRRYNPWLHGGFVLAYGLACIAWLWSQAGAPLRGSDLLALPAALVLANLGEYLVHARLGHRKTRLGKLFYQRHTGDHHSFFAEDAMPPESPFDWRVILFPPWLIVLVSLAVVLPAWMALRRFDANFAALFAGMLMASYLLYEFVHACEHLPEGHPLARLPGIPQMRRLHALHHRHGLMRDHNLNIVFPLMDWLFGTLYREDGDGQPRRLGQTRMEHTIEIDASNDVVMGYAASPEHWPQWHPSSLAIRVGAGPQPAGAHFSEDIHAGGRRGQLSWRVRAYRPGEHWSAEARGNHGLSLLVDYDCWPAGDHPARTVFRRRLEYRLPGLGWRLYNALVARRRVERESRLSLQQLKACVESVERRDEGGRA